MAPRRRARHDIVLEKSLAHVERSACIDGARNCPPEDCGGPWGYSELLDALGNPDHPRHDELTEWLEWIGLTDFDHDFFDLVGTDRELSRIKVR